MHLIRENKILSGAFGFVCVLAAGWLLNYANDTCNIAGFENKAGSVELGCFEFWFYRYQALLGALAAVGAAWYAGAMVWRQIARTEKQIVIARAQLAGDSIPILQDRIKDTQDFRDNIFRCIEAVNEGTSWINKASTDLADICGIDIDARMIKWDRREFKIIEMLESNHLSTMVVHKINVARANVQKMRLRSDVRQAFNVFVDYAEAYVRGCDNYLRAIGSETQMLSSRIDKGLVVRTNNIRPIRDANIEKDIQVVFQEFESRTQRLYDEAIDQADKTISVA